MAKWGRTRSYKTNEEIDLDEMTEDWLREHDPYYTDHKKGKRRRTEYNYETRKQEGYRRSKELPFSSLFDNKLFELAEKNVDVKHYMNE